MKRTLISALCLSLVWAGLGAPLMPFNGAFEEADSSGGAAGWALLTIGAPASITRDTLVKRSGQASIRVDAMEITRAYAMSQSIEVAPGERFSATLWVMQTNVPAGKGTVIAIAEFLDRFGRQREVAKISVADTTKQGWQQIAGSAVVPENASSVRLRLGFSYSQGTCWWDDVQMLFDKPIAARFDLPHGRLSPAQPEVRVIVLNRERTKGAAKVVVSAGGVTNSQALTLSGKELEEILVPIRLKKPGRVALEGAVHIEGKQTCAFKTQGILPEALKLDPLVPTHWAIEDGPATISGRIHLAISSERLAKSKLRIRLLDSQQQLHGEELVGNLKDGVNEFSLKSPSLLEGDYVLEAGLIGSAVDMAARQPWFVIPRRKALVTLTKDGFPSFDGRVIFPVGMFNGGARMKEMNGAFTVSHAYNSVEAEVLGQLDDTRAKAFLDESERAGLKALMLLPRRALFTADWETIRRRVLMFRNHPGLLAWDEEEGIARGDMKVEVLRKLSEILKELDPHHPFMVGDPSDVIGRMPADRSNFFASELMDIGMWWWYPFPASAQANALEGDEASGTEVLGLPSFLVNATTPKPLWVGIQAYKKPGPTGRYPTCAEYRFQVYAAIAAGAKGTMWYGGSVTGGVYLNPEQGDWACIKQLAGEITGLSSVLTGETLADVKVQPAGAPIRTIVKRDSRRTVLVAVNLGFKPQDVSMALPGMRSATRLPDRTAVPVRDGILNYRFEPIEALVLECVFAGSGGSHRTN
jgi:hypothetical protein